MTSLAACLYVGIDPIFNPPPKGYLPLSTDACPLDNTTALLTNIPDYGNASVFMSTTADYGNATLSYVLHSFFTIKF